MDTEHRPIFMKSRSLTKRWMNVEMSSMGRKVNNTGKVEVSSVTREIQMTSI